MKKFLLLPLIAFCGFGCMSAQEHQQALHSTNEREMTLGIAQRDISVGMSQADVAVALGSPNIVTKDSEGNESWIYDKIATEVSYSKDSGGAGIGVGGGLGSWGVILGGASYSKSAGAAAQTQKTLTIVIKFDENQAVKSLSYHSSKF